MTGQEYDQSQNNVLIYLFAYIVYIVCILQQYYLYNVL